MVKLQLVVLISGNGTNLQAIIDGIRNGIVDANIAAVISDKIDAYGLERARAAKILPLVQLPAKYATREQYDAALATIIKEINPDLIVLAGFMRILSAEFVQTFAGRIINIHPSLLPKYPGLDTHQCALNAQDAEHGCSVHLVTEELDAGPILAQAKLSINASDTPKTLKDRVQQLEHQLLPQVIQDFAMGKLPLPMKQ